MTGMHHKLFARIISRNLEVYLLKILTLAIAFASSILVILFSLNEFGFDKFHEDSDKVFRIIQKNTDDQYSGNRLSAKIPAKVISQLQKNVFFKDSFIISRAKVMNKVSVLYGDKSFHDQKIHAMDPSIKSIFSFEISDGDASNFNSSMEVKAMISERSAQKYMGTTQAAGRRMKLCTLDDTVYVTIAAVFKNFPDKSHEDFDVFIAFNSETITALNFDSQETGVYGRSLTTLPERYKFPGSGIITEAKMIYSVQPIGQLYFGPRVLGEEARHGDKYSVVILISIASLIFFLALASFVNLTTLTLPYRSKELAVKKLAGTNQTNLLYSFLKESSALVGISLAVGLLILIITRDYIEPILHLKILMILKSDLRLLPIIAILFIILAVSPVLMTLRFVRASPNRLLRTDTITFPRLKRVITFIQLGISIFLIITSVVVRRQINYSLVKEPGHNHDQIVYLNSPSGITNEGIMALRSGCRTFNPNILNVMAVSQLPDRITSKEIGSEVYLLFADPGFFNFFDLRMEEGHWFGSNSADSAIVTNRKGKERMGENQPNVIGVVRDLNGVFNQPEKPVKIKLAHDNNYNWLCVRVLEVDIRRTVRLLSDQFSTKGEKAHVNYLNKNFHSWIEYQDRLNTLSEILTIISGLLSCCAIYGLSVSLVRDKLKQIAVHKLFGAHTVHITYLLALEFAKQMVIALAVFGPFTYILLNELLRTFVYATKFSWLDPVYPIAYCVFVIVTICGFQALNLSRTNFALALKG